jgi:hypothetical protein
MKRVKSEYRRKQQAKDVAAKSLQRTKAGLGLGPAKPPSGITPNPLVAGRWERKPRIAPTSDRIPGLAAARDFMHAHKWKSGVSESEGTVKEIRRKASKIAPAYNKGALQYLPEGINKEHWPSRLERSARRN